MEPVKESQKSLSTKLERGEVDSAPKDDAAQLVYNDALRRAISLRVEAELQAIRMYNNQRALMEPAASTKTLRDYIRVLFRHKVAIISTVASLMITVLVGLEFLTPQYSAGTRMLISGEKQVQAPYYQAINGYKNIPISGTQSEIVNSQPVIQRAAQALGLYERPLNDERQFASPLKRKWLDWENAKLDRRMKKLSPQAREQLKARIVEERLRGSIDVEPIRDTNLFWIRVKDFSPERAAKTANVIARSYVIFDIEQQLAELQLKYGDKHLAVMELKDNIERIGNDLTGVPTSALEAMGPASVKIIEQASPPLSPDGVSRDLIVLAALLISLIAGVILAFLFDTVDQTFKTPQEVESYLNLPFLGAIPRRSFRDRALVKDAKRTTAYTQAYQNISDQIYLLMRNKNSKFFLFSSPSPEEGTTTLVANLGLYLAHRANLNVLLIDANLRRPAVHRVFNMPDHFGLADVLEGKIAFDRAVQALGTTLSVLPAGRTVFNPVTLLDSAGMNDLIKLAQERYDVVLIDSPNLSHFKDAHVLASYADGLVLVVDESKTRRQVAKNAIAPLEQRNVSIFGTVLNNRTFAIPKVFYDKV